MSKDLSHRSRKIPTATAGDLVAKSSLILRVEVLWYTFAVREGHEGMDSQRAGTITISIAQAAKYVLLPERERMCGPAGSELDQRVC